MRRDDADGRGGSGTFELTAQGPFSLAASTRFLEGFAPAARRTVAEGHLHLAFPAETDGWPTVGVCVRQAGERVLGEVTGAAPVDAVRRQVARILSLDVDGSGFGAVGRRDPVAGRLQARYPGLRPVGFWSAYEAAAWALISHRIRIMQAARVKARIAESLGEAVEIHGEVVHAFPAPGRLAELTSFPGLFASKIDALSELGDAALEGRLDSDRLRALPTAEALRALRELRGIGEFSSELVLLRGAGHPDVFPSYERRLHRAMASAYQLDPDPPLERLARIADGWRPYRTWVALLLRTELEEETGEIAGRARA